MCRTTNGGVGDAFSGQGLATWVCRRLEAMKEAFACASGCGIPGFDEFAFSCIHRRLYETENMNIYDYVDIRRLFKFNPHVHIIGIDGVYSLEEHTGEVPPSR